jgi:hypothetical protein
VLEVDSVSDGSSGVLYDEGDLVRAIDGLLRLMSAGSTGGSAPQQQLDVPVAADTA